MYSLILVEAALERIPKELWRQPSVRRYAERREKPPGECLLDVSYHYSAMKKLPEREKRGRPDIAHFSLLEALGSPLAKRGFLKVYLHTHEGVAIRVASGTRLPRNYERFLGLFEQVLKTGQAPETGNPLITARKESLSTLVGGLGHEKILLREKAPHVPLKQLAEIAHRAGSAILLVGGFAHGDFSEVTVDLADREFSIYYQPLEAWIVVSRLLSALEVIHGLWGEVT